MAAFTRRWLLQATGSLIGATALSGTPLREWATAWAATQPFRPEQGARLRLLRWHRFVESELDAFMENIEAYTDATGVPVRVDSVGLDDIQPKASVAATIGAGPDLVWGLLAFPHLFPDKLVDVTDVADYLEAKYGGWYPIAEEYGQWKDRWIAIPWCVSGAYINYRVSWVRDAGFDGVPGNTDGFLKLCAALKKSGHPPGMALANDTGDANSWCHWVVWAFGGRLVDEHDNVAINSPETIASLEYARELYRTFTPGTTSWLGAHNNKAFLSGKIGLTNNAISIYTWALTNKKEIAPDIDHAYWPVGPAGRPTELHFPNPMVIFKYTEFPNAAKAFVTFMMEGPQYAKWLQGSAGYFTHTLKAHNNHPVWTEDAKRVVFREASERALSIAHAGTLGYAAAGALSDFIIVNMVAEAATGRSSPREAAARAEKRANRYYNI